MNKKCCFVPSCSYDGFSSVHCMPKKNPEVVEYLLKGLGFPENFQLTSSFRMCRKHFTDDSIITHGTRSFLIASPTLKTDPNIRTSELVGTFEELKKFLPHHLETFTKKGWQIFEGNDEVYISLIKVVATRGVQIKRNIVINRLKRISAFADDKKIKIDINVSRNDSHVKITKWSDLKLIIESLEKEVKIDQGTLCNDASSLLGLIESSSPTVVRKIKTLQGQLRNLTIEEGVMNKKPYDVESMVMALQLFNVSPACYRTLKSYFSLPHENTLSHYEIGKEKARIDRQNKTGEEKAGVKRKAEKMDGEGSHELFADEASFPCYTLDSHSMILDISVLNV